MNGGDGDSHDTRTRRSRARRRQQASNMTHDTCKRPKQEARERGRKRPSDVNGDSNVLVRFFLLFFFLFDTRFLCLELFFLFLFDTLFIFDTHFYLFFLFDTRFELLNEFIWCWYLVIV